MDMIIKDILMHERVGNSGIFEDDYVMLYPKTLDGLVVDDSGVPIRNTMVRNTQTINGHALTGDIVLTPDDVGALAENAVAADTAQITHAIIYATDTPPVVPGKLWLKPI